MEFNSTNIEKGDEYEFDISKYFFADTIRVIILIYIIISFIFNILYLISSLKKNFKKIPVDQSDIVKTNLIIIGNIIFINFLHTFSYLYEWVLQNMDGKDSLYVDDEGKKCIQDCKDNPDYNQIGGLLIGNMDNMAACKTQGFFLVFCPLSQDIIINIFFYLINKQSRLHIKIIFRFLIFAGYCFPIVLSIIYLLLDSLGLNDKFCFIKKFNFEEHNGYKTYKLYSRFLPLICLFYLIRLLNLIISILFLNKIVKYIKRNDLGKRYIFKLCAILVLQCITIIFSLIYRLGGIISRTFSRDFSNTFLIINTSDGVLFPVVVFFLNNMHKGLCYKNTDDYNINLLSDDNDITTGNVTLQNQTKNVDKTDITNIKEDKNNFSLSYL